MGQMKNGLIRQRKEMVWERGKAALVALLLISMLCNMLAVPTQAAKAGPGNAVQGEAGLGDAVQGETGEGPGDATQGEAESSGNVAETGQEAAMVSPGDGQGVIGGKDVWRCVGDKEYYFNKYGICTIIFDVKTGTCQKYSNGRMCAVKKDICRLRDGKYYYFNAKGVRDLQKGFKKVSSKKYIQVKKGGYVAAKMENTKNIWKFYEYDYKKNKWVKQKDTWKIVDCCQYYFNKKGNCTKIYNINTQKGKEFTQGKMRLVKKGICRLRNGRYYYFNARGVRVTKKGWQKPSSKKYIQVGKSKWVTAKMQDTKRGWCYQKYDYHKKKWVKQKKVWLTVSKKRYYFNGAGSCTRMYNTVTRKCYDYNKKKLQLVKNDIRSIRGKEYYFGANGVKAGEAGMYRTCHGNLVYVASNGAVKKKISGQILSCSVSNGKVVSCKVKDGVYMCYYDGGAEPRRRIDTSRPMVALTYDDGPSVYTTEILDILRQHGGVATFFVVGQRVLGHADIVRSACQMGCEIGNHTYSHQVLTKVGAAQIQSQIGATNSAVQNVAGVAPVVMRPPGGGQNPAVREAVGMPLILWSIDTLDWKTRNAASTQDAVLGKVRDGDIVLMHDLYSQTAAASRVIIPELVRRGYQLVTVSELSDCRGPMVSGGVYSAFR